MLTEEPFAVLSSAPKTQKYVHRQKQWDVPPFQRNGVFLPLGQSHRGFILSLSRSSASVLRDWTCSVTRAELQYINHLLGL